MKAKRLAWNAIRANALAFSKKHADDVKENAEAQTFWNDFLEVFGVDRRRVGHYEQPAVRGGGGRGRIDMLWKGVLMVEHKSRDQDLDAAYDQLRDYFPSLTDDELPALAVVSDFARIRVQDLRKTGTPAGKPIEFPLSELADNVRLFDVLCGLQAPPDHPQVALNQKAALRMGRLHDALKDDHYDGHALRVLLVRLLFCLFAEDTGIFHDPPRNAFADWLDTRTADDGSDTGSRLVELFDTLNTPEEQRSTRLDETVRRFPYVNGKLFAESIRVPSFDAKLRKLLKDATHTDWSQISPAIFGALFQSVMDAGERRELGAHYTSEANILKVIGPLFLDDLRARFEVVRKDRRHDRAALRAFHDELGR